MKHLRLCLLVLLFAQAANAQDAAPFLLKFIEGETLRYRVTQTAKLAGEAGNGGAFVMRTEQATDLVWRVASVDEEGTAKIEQSVAAIRYKNSSPIGEVGFDSTMDEPPLGVAAMLAPSARAMLELPVTFTVSPAGEIGDVTVPEDLAGSLERVPGASDVIVAEAAIRALVACVVPRLPEEGGPGVRQMESSVARLVAEFRLGEAEEAGLVPIAWAARVEPNSDKVRVTKSEGVTRVHRQSGRVRNAESTLMLVTKTEEGEATLEQKTEVKLLEDEAAKGE